MLQADLAYDPEIYSRDHGGDWETRSIASLNLPVEPKAPYANPEIPTTELEIPDDQPLLSQVCAFSAEPVVSAHASHGSLASGGLLSYGSK